MNKRTPSKMKLRLEKTRAWITTGDGSPPDNNDILSIVAFCEEAVARHEKLAADPAEPYKITRLDRFCIAAVSAMQIFAGDPEAHAKRAWDLARAIERMRPKPNPLPEPDGT